MSDGGRDAVVSLLEQQAKLVELCQKAVDQAGLEEITWLCLAASMYTIIETAGSLIEVCPQSVKNEVLASEELEWN